MLSNLSLFIQFQYIHTLRHCIGYDLLQIRSHLIPANKCLEIFLGIAVVADKHSQFLQMLVAVLVFLLSCQFGIVSFIWAMIYSFTIFWLPHRP